MTKWIGTICIVIFFGCDSGKTCTSGDQGKKPTIAVVSYPLYYFASEIGGEHVHVYFPSIGGDPAYWKPDTRQVLNFQKADMILTNGAGFEKWMEKVSLPSSKVVNTSLAFKDSWIEVDEGVAHSHGSEGEHVHKGIAFTTWVNFDFAIQQARVVHESLCKLLPDNKQTFDDNFRRLSLALKNLDEKMQSVGSKLDGTIIIASHPVYQYLEHRYRLNIHSMHWEPSQYPGEADWQEFMNIVEKNGAKIMIWESEPVETTRAKLHQMGLEVVVFNPCSNRPDVGDFLTVMQENVTMFVQSAAL
jgi:zinc transport system substrate-binding protein